MAKPHSTGYIVGFAVAVCLICSVIVSGAAVSLKDRQDANALVDKRMKVLSVAGLLRPDEVGALSNDEVNERFENAIVPKLVNTETGEYLEHVDGAVFKHESGDIDASTYDQGHAAKGDELGGPAPENNARVLRMPKVALVYHVLDGDKVDKLILPVEGYGLWGTLYGFIALETDGQTIAGLTFYKHIETPGLGGEVDNPAWKAKWKGRKVFGEDGAPQIAVIKGQAGAPGDAPYAVDGLSGATITSRGVTNLLQFWLSDDGFKPYIETFRTEMKGGE